MRWDRTYDSPNLEDRRHAALPRLGGMGMGGLGGLLPLLFRFGWKGILIVGALLLVMNYATCPGGVGTQGAMQLPPEKEAAEDELVAFVGFVFDDVQQSWVDDFEARGLRYEPAKIVVFRQAVSTECGTAPSSVGPFYCPLDRKVYVDLSFYQDLHRRFGAPGDFAQAYVIGHELGHHVENLLGALDARTKKDQVQVELTADCLAGVWARDAERRDLLEVGDLKEAMTAAAAIGDDRLQQQATGRVDPDSFTHGSSEQRQTALDRGHATGTLDGCGL